MRNMCVALGAVCVCGVGVANAGVTYGFLENCTNNNAGDVAIGFAQLTLEISDAGLGFVDFTFTNSGPAASSITDLYWDDGTLLGLASITSGPGTSFSQGATPPNLPGGNNCSPPFVATAGFTADSNPPAQPNGVNPGEFVTVRFSLINGQTYADTIAAMVSGELRVGVHVQGFASGGSEAFVATLVPAPGALALLGASGLLAGRRRRA
ncbi:MAG: hypothetical protein RBS39_09025 [Phycisphaerales bacterium]|jgi:hypothetical protein|nr:hypothetical protein [Phycisphaerales bacterium]